jgi:hypothetical protein
MRRMPTTSLPTLGFAAFVGLACLGLVFVPALFAAPAGPQQQVLDRHIYLPFGLDAAGMEAVPTVRVLPPPTRQVATSPPLPTEAPPPTFTPVPSASPTAEDGGATITGRLTIDGEPALEGLGEGFGPGLLVRECFADGRCRQIARTAIDAQGVFRFRVPVPPPDNGFYQVVWLNEAADSGSEFTGADLWAGSYYSRELRVLNPGDAVDLGRMEIADIILTNPTANGLGGLPHLFTWDARKSETGDYRWAICNTPCQNMADREEKTFYTTPGLGRPQWLMDRHPPGSRVGQDFLYRWYVRADAPDGGHAESYHTRLIWFFDAALAAFEPWGLVDGEAWRPAEGDHRSSAWRPAAARQPDAVHQSSGEEQVLIHLPLTMKSARREALAGPEILKPTEPAATATTAAETALPTDPPTAEATPTFTPPPTPTVSMDRGRIIGRITWNDKPLAIGFGEASIPGSPLIELRMSSGVAGGWSLVDNAQIIDEQGLYVFDNPPALPEGRVYQVRWRNDDPLSADLWLRYWWSREITSFGDGSEVDLGSFEVGDVVMTAPLHDSAHFTSGVGIEFKWDARGHAKDIFRWAVADDCVQEVGNSRKNVWSSPPLGKKTSYTTMNPSGFRFDQKYCWFVLVDDGEGGSGSSFYDRKVSWCSSAATCGGLAPAAAVPADLRARGPMPF